jgi:hypothetical protein
MLSDEIEDKISKGRTKLDGQLIDRGAYRLIIDLLEGYIAANKSVGTKAELSLMLKEWFKIVIPQDFNELAPIVLSRLGIATWSQLGHVIRDICLSMNIYQASDQEYSNLSKFFLEDNTNIL